MPKVYAFFSSSAYRASNGDGSYLYKDANTGLKNHVNYVGEMIDGLPGSFVDGKLVRPSNPESYTLVGEVARGKLRLHSPVLPTRGQFRLGFRHSGVHSWLRRHGLTKT